MTARSNPESLTWRIRVGGGPAGRFHERDLPSPIATPHPTTPHPAVGEVWIHHVEGPALVLGSAQPNDCIDGERAVRAGWEVCRRRSGGGLVVLRPGDSVWIDLALPPDHPLVDDDVHRAFDWVGATWQRTLESVGVVGVDRHHGPVERRQAGRLLCFAGLGAGELSVAGTKVVGLSQRRTRNGTRFQTMLSLRPGLDGVADLADGPLRAVIAEAERAPFGLHAASPTHAAVPLARWIGTFLRSLPTDTGPR